MSVLRRAVLGWLIGGALGGLLILPICDLSFDCGCVWPWHGGVAHCDIQTPGPPDCPWCDDVTQTSLAIGSVYLLNLGFAAWVARRRGLLGVALAAWAGVAVGTLLAGVLTAWLLGRPLLAGL